MEFLVSYKVTKRNEVNDIVVENINALVLDTKSTPKHPIDFKNVVDRNVLDKWSFEICNTERFIDGYEYTILNCSIISS